MDAAKNIVNFDTFWEFEKLLNDPISKQKISDILGNVSETLIAAKVGYMITDSDRYSNEWIIATQFGEVLTSVSRSILLGKLDQLHDILAKYAESKYGEGNYDPQSFSYYDLLYCSENPGHLSVNKIQEISNAIAMLFKERTENYLNSAEANKEKQAWDVLRSFYVDPYTGSPVNDKLQSEVLARTAEGIRQASAAQMELEIQMNISASNKAGAAITDIVVGTHKSIVESQRIENEQVHFLASNLFRLVQNFLVSNSMQNSPVVILPSVVESNH